MQLSSLMLNLFSFRTSRVSSRTMNDDDFVSGGKTKSKKINIEDKEFLPFVTRKDLMENNSHRV